MERFKKKHREQQTSPLTLNTDLFFFFPSCFVSVEMGVGATAVYQNRADQAFNVLLVYVTQYIQTFYSTVKRHRGINNCIKAICSDRLAVQLHSGKSD